MVANGEIAQGENILFVHTGGNKLRKLEYFLYDAQQKGATALVTVGGPQTAHGRRADGRHDHQSAGEIAAPNHPKQHKTRQDDMLPL